MKRRSWEGSRNILSSQPELEEPQDIPPIKEISETPSSVPSSIPSDSTPVRNHKEIIIETEKPEEKEKEKEKEKEQSKFARKLKTLRRG